MTGVRQNHAYIVAGLAVPQISSIALVAVTAWVMGPTGRGEIAFAQATASMLAVIGGWGFYLSAAATRQTTVPRQYLELTLGFTGILGFGVVLLAGLAPTGLLSLPVAVPVGFAAVMTAGTTYCQRIAQARISDREYFMIGSIPPLVSLTIVLPVVLLGAGPALVIGIWSVGAAISFLIAVSRVWQLAVAVRSSTTRPRAYLRVSSAVGAANVSSFLVNRADTVILGLVSNATQVGYYSLAVAMAGLVMYVAEAVSLRTISSFSGAQDRASYLDESRKRARSAAWLSAVLALPFLVAGWIVLNYWLVEFRPAYPVFVILCVAAIPAAYARVLISAASMIGMRRLLSWYTGACFVLALSYVPVASLGAVYLAWTSLAVYTLLALLVGWGMRWAQPAASVKSASQ